MKILTILLLFINIILAFGSSIEKLVKDVIDFDMICQLHYNSSLTDNQITDWISNGINYVVDTSVLYENASTTEEVADIRDNIYNIFNKLLEEADSTYSTDNDSLDLDKREMKCNWLKFIGCHIYYVGITACITAYGCVGLATLGATLAPGAVPLTTCISGLGAGAVTCFADCF